MYLFRKKNYIRHIFFSIQKLKLHVKMKKKMSSPTAVDVYVISLEEGIAHTYYYKASRGITGLISLSHSILKSSSKKKPDLKTFFQEHLLCIYFFRGLLIIVKKYIWIKKVFYLFDPIDVILIFFSSGKDPTSRVICHSASAVLELCNPLTEKKNLLLIFPLTWQFDAN